MYTYLNFNYAYGLTYGIWMLIFCLFFSSFRERKNQTVPSFVVGD